MGLSIHFHRSFFLEKYPTEVPKDAARKVGHDGGKSLIVKDLHPTQLKCTPESFLQSSQRLLDLFTLNLYALSSTIELLPTKRASAEKNSSINRNKQQQPVGAVYRIRLQAPATLWSLQVLRFRKDQPMNAFELKVLDALARRCGGMLEIIDTYVTGGIEMVHVVKLLPLGGEAAEAQNAAAKAISLPNTFLL